MNSVPQRKRPRSYWNWPTSDLPRASLFEAESYFLFFFESAFVVNSTNPMVLCEWSFVAVAHTHTPRRTARPPTAPPRRERDEEMGQRRRSHEHVWEGSVMRHAARRLSLSGTAPPLRGRKVVATPYAQSTLTPSPTALPFPNFDEPTTVASAQSTRSASSCPRRPSYFRRSKK